MSYEQCLGCIFNRTEERDIWCDKGHEQFRADPWWCTDKEVRKS